MNTIECELNKANEQLAYERFISELLYDIVSDEHGERCNNPSKYYARVDLAKTIWSQSRNYSSLESENEHLKEQVEISMRLVGLQQQK